jgi:hypothetical protein
MRKRRNKQSSFLQITRDVGESRKAHDSQTCIGNYIHITSDRYNATGTSHNIASRINSTNKTRANRRGNLHRVSEKATLRSSVYQPGQEQKRQHCSACRVNKHTFSKTANETNHNARQKQKKKKKSLYCSTPTRGSESTQIKMSHHTKRKEKRTKRLASKTTQKAGDTPKRK